VKELLQAGYKVTVLDNLSRGHRAVVRVLAGAAAYGLKYISLRYFNAAGADPEGELGEDHQPETHLIPLVLQAALGLRPKVTIFGERGYSVNQAAACFLKPFWT
jgi:UDP-glucose 4-epimerase